MHKEHFSEHLFGVAEKCYKRVTKVRPRAEMPSLSI